MSRTVMTVDDSATIRQTVSMTLELDGHKVIECADAYQALERLGSCAPDVIITDLNMPGMNGIELIREVRQLPAFKFTPILLLTTESHPEKKQEAKAAGATGWIVKPFTPDQILSAIKRVVR